MLMKPVSITLYFLGMQWKSLICVQRQYCSKRLVNKLKFNCGKVDILLVSTDSFLGVAVLSVLDWVALFLEDTVPQLVCSVESCFAPGCSNGNCVQEY